MSGETKLNELIARLEAATGPDQDIDADIWDFIGLTEGDAGHCARWISQNGRADLTRRDYLLAWSKRFTGSIDAAVKLVPDSFRAVRISYSLNPAPGRQFCHATLERDAESMGRDMRDDEECKIHVRNHHTAALALATAAMKARRHD